MNKKFACSTVELNDKGCLFLGHGLDNYAENKVAPDHQTSQQLSHSIPMSFLSTYNVVYPGVVQDYLLHRDTHYQPRTY